jgi:hypothetical protein
MSVDQLAAEIEVTLHPEGATSRRGVLQALAKLDAEARELRSRQLSSQLELQRMDYCEQVRCG